MSLDVTQSIARLPGEPTASGMSFKLNYAKRFDELNSQITFAGYRFSQRKFMNMSQYLQERYGDYDKITTAVRKSCTPSPPAKPLWRKTAPRRSPPT